MTTSILCPVSIYTKNHQQYIAFYKKKSELLQVHLSHIPSVYVGSSSMLQSKRHLRSVSDTCTFVTPRVNTKTFGENRFLMIGTVLLKHSIKQILLPLSKLPSKLTCTIIVSNFFVHLSVYPSLNFKYKRSLTHSCLYVYNVLKDK